MTAAGTGNNRKLEPVEAGNARKALRVLPGWSAPPWFLALLLALLVPAAVASDALTIHGQSLWVPAYGITFAVLILFGPTTIPLLVGTTTAAQLLAGHVAVPVAVVVTAASANAAALAIWAWAVRAAGVDVRLRTLRDASVVAVAGAVGTLASTGLTMVVLLAWEPSTASRFWPGADHLFVTAAAGAFAVTPLLLLAASLFGGRRRAGRQRLDKSRIFETVVLIAVFVAAAGLSAGTHDGAPLYYPLLIPLVWAALRLGVPGTAAGVAVGTCVLAVIEHHVGLPSDEVMRLEIFLAVFSLAGLCFGAAQSERQDAQRALESSQAALAESEERLKQLAIHDPLTGLPNRVHLQDRLDRALSTRDAAGERVGVLYLDLDGFKEINDRFGHETGDRVLSLTGRRLRSVIRPTDVAARVGGDEFVILCERLNGDGDLEAIASRVAQAVEAPFVLGRRKLSVGASIGMAAAENGQSAAELIGRADRAMYRVKHASRRHRRAGAAQRVG